MAGGKRWQRTLLVQDAESDMKYVKVKRDKYGYVYDLNRYVEYLSLHLEKFPPGAKGIVTSEWHRDFRHEKCLHDARLVTIKIDNENAVDSVAAGIRIKFLNAYENFFADFFYKNVQSYLALMRDPIIEGVPHGDVMADEVSLTVSGLVRHEIKLTNSRFVIVASDVVCTWTEINN